METKLNYKRTFLIGLAFLSICSFWQMYDNIIPLILQNTYHLGETMTGAVMALDNVLAIFLLPVFGTLSDKVHTKLGRRMPFIVSGTILAVIFMMLLPMIDNAEKARWGTVESFSNQVIFLAVLFFTLVSMGLYRSPAVALMPDVTPNHLRSRANAVINLMGAVGGVYALIMIKVLVGKGETPDYLPLFASIAAVMAIAVGILVMTIRENKLREEVEKAEAAIAETIEEKAMAEGVEAVGENGQRHPHRDGREGAEQNIATAAAKAGGAFIRQPAEQRQQKQSEDVVRRHDHAGNAFSHVEGFRENFGDQVVVHLPEGADGQKRETDQYGALGVELH